MYLKAGLNLLQVRKFVSKYLDDVATKTIKTSKGNDTLPKYMREAQSAKNIDGLFEPKVNNTINSTNKLRKRHYSRNELQQLFNSNPNMRKIVGSVPKNWGKILKSKKATEDVDTIFSKFINNIHNGISEVDAIKTLENELQFLLQTEVKMSLLGSGTFGKTYKIKVNGRNYVLKAFEIDCMNTYKDQSGWAELSNAVYASDKTKNAAKFYMGKFGKTDTDTYMLTRYIDSADHDINGFVKSREGQKGKGFKMVDEISKFDILDGTPDNYIGWKIIDYGLMTETPFCKMPHRSYKILRQMCKAADTKSYKEMQRIAKQYKDDPALKEAIDAYALAISCAEPPTHKISTLREKVKMLDCFEYIGWKDQLQGMHFFA